MESRNERWTRELAADDEARLTESGRVQGIKLPVMARMKRLAISLNLMKNRPKKTTDLLLDRSLQTHKNERIVHKHNPMNFQAESCSARPTSPATVAGM